MAAKSKLASVGHIFAAVAPTIGKVVASTNPIAGALYGVATQALGSHLSIQNPTEDAVVSALSTPAPDLDAVKAADQDFQDKLMSLGVNVDSLAYSDTASARALASGLKSRFPYYAGATVIACALGGEIFFMLHGIKAGLDPVIVGRILGTIDTLASLAAGYIWGSSANAQSQSDTLSQHLNDLTSQVGNGKH